MSASNRGLGRSFESLIPTDLIDGSFDPTSQEDAKVSKLKELPVKDIAPDEDQPRKHFDEKSLQELADSIKEHGVLQPVVVTKSGNNFYTLVAGERRWRASKIAGLKTIPAIIRTLSDQHRLELSLIENVQRKDLNIIEIATAYAKLKSQFNLSMEQMSQRIGGKSVSSIANTMRLLRLPDSAKQALIENKLTEGQLRPLVNADHQLIEEILPRIIEENWSARQVEQFMVSQKQTKSKTKKPKTVTPYEKEENTIAKLYDTKVTIRSSARGSGQIILRFNQKDEFQNILKKLTRK